MPNWSQVLAEIQQERTAGNQTAFDTIRRKYLKLLFKKEKEISFATIPAGCKNLILKA